jgi:hypothetical protein
MAKHVFFLALAISVGLAVAKMFGGSFNLGTLFAPATTTTTNPCYLAALAFGEDFETGVRVNKVRNWLVTKYENTNFFSRFVMKLYRRHGLQAARFAETVPALRRYVRFVFNKILVQAV